MANDDEPFYVDENVKVTRLTAVIYGTTYRIANIGSVRVHREPRAPTWAALAVVFAVLGGALRSSPMASAVPMLFIAAAVSLAAYVATPVRHHVCVDIGDGEHLACWYKRPEEAQAVVDAIALAVERE